MEIINIKERANKIIDTINEKITIIENCEGMLPEIEKAEVALLMNDGRTYTLETLLSLDQRTDLMYDIRSKIMDNMNLAAAELMKISSAEEAPALATARQEQELEEQENAEEYQIEDLLEEQAEAEPEVPQEVPKMVKVLKKPSEKPSKSKMTIEEVQQMVNKGMTKDQIAEHYGYKCTEGVRKFIKDNNIVPAEKALELQEVEKEARAAGKSYGQLVAEQSMKANARPLTADDIPVIRQKYTNGNITIGELATELGTSKLLLHAFIEKNHLVRKKW